MKNKTIAERFMEHVNKTPSCWIWTASTDRDGYGHMWVDGKLIPTHRLAYLLFVGDIQNNFYVLHSCDNPICVNPNHLFLGSQTDNMQDMIKKNRIPPRSGENNGRSKITQKQAVEIKEKYSTGKFTQAQLSDEYGISKSAIAYITRCEHWKTQECNGICGI
jgi:hypothetical protein